MRYDNDSIRYNAQRFCFPPGPDFVGEDARHVEQGEHEKEKRVVYMY